MDIPFELILSLISAAFAVFATFYFAKRASERVKLRALDRRVLEKHVQNLVDEL